MVKRLTPNQVIAKLERIDNAIGFPWFNLNLEIHEMDDSITILTFDTFYELTDRIEEMDFQKYKWYYAIIQYEIGNCDELIFKVKGMPELTKGEENA